MKSALKEYTIGQPIRQAEGGESVDVNVVLTDSMDVRSATGWS